MDILDIDEALKDDSFIYLADTTHNDVCNILQQWRNNNTVQQQNQQQQYHHHHQQQQLPEEQAYKLNSRTFTRPKRKSAQNDYQFWNTPYANNGQNYIQQEQQHSGMPMLNMEIGGLVSPMQKSLLQDTSPPSSLCSSMDMSIGRLSNSLINSDDFSNVNFLQSKYGLELNDTNNMCAKNLNFPEKSINNSYTLSDVIRDRKALESLTLSGDATLIKDSQIAQIDDISFTLSKTASSCSTMDNSTDSVECSNNHTMIINNDNTYPIGTNKQVPQNDGISFNRTMILSEQMIGDMTFSLVENSMHAENANNIINSAETALNVTHNLDNERQASNETFKLLTSSENDETMCLSNKANTTFDCHEQQTSDERCTTPERIIKNFCESTPLASNLIRNKIETSPFVENTQTDISPIVPSSKTYKSDHIMDLTFETVSKQKTKLNTDTFGAMAHFNTMEMLDNTENPNETFSGSFQQLKEEKEDDVTFDMQDVVNLAQAEAKLLAGNDDEAQFEQMLDEFSKVELNVEQLKMKRSLDTIKKRFNYGFSGDRNERIQTDEENTINSIMNVTFDSPRKPTSMHGNLNGSISTISEDIRNHKDVLKQPIMLNSSSSGSELKNSTLYTKEFMRKVRDNSLNGASSSPTSNSSGERLLSRRSRLYDDISLLPNSSQSLNISTNTSFTMKRTEMQAEESGMQETEMTAITNIEKDIEQKTEAIVFEESGDVNECGHETADDTVHKHAQKRERDRDRFKTMKIVKPRTVNDEVSAMGTEIIVPCIDIDTNLDNKSNFYANDDLPNDTTNSEMSPPSVQRTSRRDPTSLVFNNNKSEVQETIKLTKPTNPNYLTYKKTKDKQIKYNLVDIADSYANTADPVMSADVSNALKTRMPSRSLSRPRYVSGLQKLSAATKATSASDLKDTNASAIGIGCATSSAKHLHLPLNSNSNGNGNGSGNIPQMRNQVNFSHFPQNGGNKKNPSQLKSPMGIKSKSFSNLSNNFGYPMTIASGAIASGTSAKTSSFGLRKINSGSSAIEKQLKTNLQTNITNAQSSASDDLPVDQQQHKANSEEAVFKVPKLVSGLRTVSGSTAVKRACLVRPSSGYYSLNVTSKSVPDMDVETGRHSPAESMSSASSRSSNQSIGCALKTAVNCENTTVTSEINVTNTTNKTATSTTGMNAIGTSIPKPSGLRPPSNVKRSALPRPASIVRR